MNELLTIDVSGKTAKGLGALKYKFIPRINDWIEIETDGKAFMFEVVKVAHSSVGDNSNIYVKPLKDSLASICDLCQQD